MAINILLVDDSETLHTQIKRPLIEAGYSITEACDGLDGLDKIKEKDFQLILCDINMPNMDGLTMVSKLPSPMPTVFMLTTESSPAMKARGKELGVRAWLTKPVAVEKMLAAIKKVTE